MSKHEYFNATPAETYTRMQGYLYNRDVMASNFRALFSLQYNQWSKQKMSPQSLWPLDIDQTLSAEEIYERNQKIIKDYEARRSIHKTGT